MIVYVVVTTEGGVVLERFPVRAWANVRDASAFAVDVREHVLDLFGEPEEWDPVEGRRE